MPPSSGSSSPAWARRCAAILITHGHWDHLGGVADLAEGTGAPVYMAEDERALLEKPDRLRAAGRPAAALHGRTRCSQGDETLELAGITFETLRVPGHSPGHLAFHADGCLFSGDVLFAGSVGRTDLPGADWDDAARVDPRRSRSAFRPRRSSTPGTARRPRSAPSSPRNPFLAELRAS